MTATRLNVHSLSGRIDRARLRRAWQAVKRNRGAAGVEGGTIEMFEATLEDNPTTRRGRFRLAARLHALKRRGGSHAQPVRRAYVPKGNGRRRPLGMPAPIERPLASRAGADADARRHACLARYPDFARDTASSSHPVYRERRRRAHRMRSGTARRQRRHRQSGRRLSR